MDALWDKVKMICQSMFLLLLVSSPSVPKPLLSEVDDMELLVGLARDILESPEYSECSLVLSRDENRTSHHLEAFLRSRHHRGSSWPTVLFNNPTGSLPREWWRQHRGISRPEQMYSFSTMPPEVRSRMWPGGSCTLNLFLLASVGDLPDAVLQTGAFVRLRNLQDMFLFHFREGDPAEVMMRDPAAGIKFKLASTRDSNDTKRLILQTVCFFCLEEGQPMTLYLPRSGIDLYPDMTRNMNGLNMTVPFYTETDSHHAKKVAKIRGRLYLRVGDSVALSLDDFFGIHAVLQQPVSVDTTSSAYQYPNGTWAGLIGEMLSGKYDAVMVYVLNDAVYNRVYVAPDGWDMHMTFVTVSPDVFFNWYQLIMPFTWGSWLGLSLSILVCAVVLHCLLRNRGTRRTSLISCIASLNRVLIEQPESLPNITSVRILIGSFWILAMVVTCGYRSKYVEMVAVPDMEPLPTTFEEMYQAGYKPVIPFINTFVTQQITPYLKNPSHIRLFNESEFTSSTEACLEAVLDNPSVACMAHDFLLNQAMGMITQYRDRLRVSPTKEFYITTRLALPSGSVINKAINDWVSRVFQSGLLNIWVKDNFQLGAYKTRGQEDQDEPQKFLVLKHLSSIFMFWSGGIGVAFFIWVVELCSGICTSNNSNADLKRPENIRKLRKRKVPSDPFPIGKYGYVK